MDLFDVALAKAMAGGSGGGSGGERFIVTIARDENYNRYLDKTYDEIMAAYNAGMRVEAIEYFENAINGCNVGIFSGWEYWPADEENPAYYGITFAGGAAGIYFAETSTGTLTQG